MNWEFILKYLPMYEKAAWLTLRIGLLGIVFAIIVGFVCSTIQYYKVPVLRQIVAVYIELSRNTPLLVQLFFIYYGLPKIGIQTNAEACGVAGLAFLGGSYMAEAFRSGLEAIEPIQTESAYSLGMNRYQTMRYIILPQAMSISVPAFVANVIFLLKETERVQCDQPDGSDVYCKRPDRSLLQDNREFIPACGFLSDPIIADFHFGQSAGKEAALCRIWGLRFY